MAITYANSITLRDVVFRNNFIVNSVDCSNVKWWGNSLYYAFDNCRNLTAVSNIHSNITNMEGTFKNCQNLTYVESLPPQTTYLNAAFHNCTNLTTIPSIPDSVKYMGRTFYECTNLAGNIYIYSNQVINADSCFNNTTLQKNVYIPFTYENGEYTKTYNSFTSLGYDTTGTLDGVYLKDIAHIPSGSGGTPDPTPNPNTTK